MKARCQDCARSASSARSVTQRLGSPLVSMSATKRSLTPLLQQGLQRRHLLVEALMAGGGVLVAGLELCRLGEIVRRVRAEFLERDVDVHVGQHDQQARPEWTLPVHC
jgi:hypothetical protein